MAAKPVAPPSLGALPPQMPPSLSQVHRSHSAAAAPGDGDPSFFSLVRQATTIQRQHHQWSESDKGARVRVRVAPRSHNWVDGTLQCIIQDQPMSYVAGVVLDVPRGDCDGTHDGTKYFDCLPNHGIFRNPNDHMLFIGKLSSTPVDSRGWPISDERRAEEGTKLNTLDDVQLKAMLTEGEIRCASVSEWEWLANGATWKEREWRRFTPKEEAQLTAAFIKHDKTVAFERMGEEKTEEAAAAAAPAAAAAAQKGKGGSDEDPSIVVDLDWLVRKDNSKAQIRQVRGTILGQRVMPQRALMNRPRYWETQTEQVQLFDVAPGSPEFLEVDALFKGHEDEVTPEPDRTGLKFGDTGFTINKITRVQNLPLWEMYEMKREIIKEQYPVQNDPVERYLFHGSGGCPCKAIYESTQCGFDHRRSGGGYHGAGFYVSTAAKYSDSYGNEASDSNLGRGKHMFMVRAAIGMPKIYSPGTKTREMKAPPQMSSLEYKAVKAGVPWHKIHLVVAEEAQAEAAIAEAVVTATGPTTPSRTMSTMPAADDGMLAELEALPWPEGFRKNLARRALRACDSSSIDDAMGWLIAHAEVPGVDDPLPGDADWEAGHGQGLDHGETNRAQLAGVHEEVAEDMYFDCVSGWHDGARMYVFYDNTHCYPEYIASYTM